MNKKIENLSCKSSKNGTNSFHRGRQNVHCFKTVREEPAVAPPPTLRGELLFMIWGLASFALAWRKKRLHKCKILQWRRTVSKATGRYDLFGMTRRVCNLIISFSRFSGIAGVAYPRIGLVLQKFAWPGLLNRTCAFGSLPGDWARNATALSSLVLISVASGLKDLALKRFDATSSWPLALHCFFLAGPVL